ncbi:MAG TPA: hypothetical protein VG271_18495 [Beijerinckiaceae bacterium]|nr:hypothetical protein [Beijerinckiaceae bacterium]
MAASPHSIRGTPGGATDKAAGSDHSNIEGEANPSIVPPQSRNHCLVLTERKRGQASDSFVSIPLDGEACTGRGSVVRPWIVRLRIDETRELRQLITIGRLQDSARAYHRGQMRLVRFVERDVTRDRVSSGVQSGQIFKQPRCRDAAVSIGRQQHGIRTRLA